jgi:asparagine synthase (glutamine-hydrolysing)
LESAWRRRLPAWFRRSVLRRAASRWPKADWLPRPLRLKTTLTNLAYPPDAAYANTISLCRLPLRKQLLAADIRAQINGYRPDRVIRECFGSSCEHDLLRMQAADVGVLLPDDFLTKVDRASMAYGLEVRPPLVDHELLELSFALPPDLKIRRGETKWILKRLFCDRLPVDVVRRPKQGFEMPVDAWLRAPLRDVFESTVLAPSAAIGDLIERPVVRRLYDQHLRGRAGTAACCGPSSCWPRGPSVISLRPAGKGRPRVRRCPRSVQCPDAHEGPPRDP